MKGWEKLTRWGCLLAQVEDGVSVSYDLRKFCNISMPRVEELYQHACDVSVLMAALLLMPLLVLKIAMLDGVAQLWEHSPQWFCLVCKKLLEIGVLSPISAVRYFFREDNNNAIALSPFLWEVSLQQRRRSGSAIYKTFGD